VANLFRSKLLKKRIGRLVRHLHRQVGPQWLQVCRSPPPTRRKYGTLRIADYSMRRLGVSDWKNGSTHTFVDVMFAEESCALL